MYSLWYFLFSVFGNVNNFFFAAHLLDVAFAVKTLKTILQSVTHNGKQVKKIFFYLLNVGEEFFFNYLIFNCFLARFDGDAFNNRGIYIHRHCI